MRFAQTYDVAQVDLRKHVTIISHVIMRQATLKRDGASSMLNLTPDDLICRVLTLVIAFTVHEFAHAWVADYFGEENS